MIVIGLCWRERGCGPTWQEFAGAVGWPQLEREQRMRELLPVGVRWRTGVERSLCVLPGALEAALAVVREARAEEAA